MEYRKTSDPAPSTATLEAAREHARSLAGAATTTSATVPSTRATDLPDGVAAADVVWDELVPPGGYAARRLPRGTLLGLVDLEGDACVALVVHRAEHPAERLNVADTVKVQWQAYLGPGALLLSDMGRVLMTVVEDTSGHHDALCGTTNATTRGGAWSDSPSGRDLLCLGLAKHGLGRRDLPPNVNLFRSVRVADDGELLPEPSTVPGAHVTLRAELDVLVTVANVAHPLDDTSAPVTPVRLTAWRAPVPDRDPIRRSTPERERAFENTDELLVGGAR
ncbi:MAG: urea amidolyase associated protein UAAP1 [Microthrixaceae bacterium]